MSFFDNLETSKIIVIVAISLIVILLIVNQININAQNGSISSNTNINDTSCGCQLPPKKIEKLEDVSNNTPKMKLALYYTNWCGYSKMFLPDWEKIKKSDLDVIFEENDCEKSQNCSKFNVTGYPTLLLHKPDGTIIPFENKPRTYEFVVDFVKNNMK